MSQYISSLGTVLEHSERYAGVRLYYYWAGAVVVKAF